MLEITTTGAMRVSRPIITPPWPYIMQMRADLYPLTHVNPAAKAHQKRDLAKLTMQPLPKNIDTSDC